MHGQWVGRYVGTNTGLLVIDLDDMGDHYEGLVYVWDDRPWLPSSFAPIRTADKSKKFRLHNVPVAPVHPHTNEVTNWHQIQSLFPGVTFPSTVNVDWDG